MRQAVVFSTLVYSRLSSHVCLLVIILTTLPVLFPGSLILSAHLSALTLEKYGKMQNNHNSRQYWFIYQSCTYFNV